MRYLRDELQSSIRLHSNVSGSSQLLVDDRSWRGCSRRNLRLDKGVMSRLETYSKKPEDQMVRTSTGN
jgi:hypothetical protein